MYGDDKLNRRYTYRYCTHKRLRMQRAFLTERENKNADKSTEDLSEHLTDVLSITTQATRSLGKLDVIRYYLSLQYKYCLDRAIACILHSMNIKNNRPI